MTTATKSAAKTYRFAPTVDVAEDTAVIDAVCLKSVARWLKSPGAARRMNEGTRRHRSRVLLARAEAITDKLDLGPDGKPAGGEPTWKMPRLSPSWAMSVYLTREAIMEAFPEGKAHRSPFPVLGTARTTDRLAQIIDCYFWNDATPSEAKTLRNLTDAHEADMAKG